MRVLIEQLDNPVPELTVRGNMRKSDSGTKAAKTKFQRV